MQETTFQIGDRYRARGVQALLAAMITLLAGCVSETVRIVEPEIEPANGGSRLRPGIGTTSSRCQFQLRAVWRPAHLLPAGSHAAPLL